MKLFLVSIVVLLILVIISPLPVNSVMYQLRSFVIGLFFSLAGYIPYVLVGFFGLYLFKIIFVKGK